MQSNRTAEQAAWAAGLFEGEGWMGPRGKTSGEASLGTTDYDVVVRFAEVVGFGTITTERRPSPHKTLYRWQVTNAAQTKALLELFLPWLGDRRRAAAEALIGRLAQCRGANATKTHCPRGHEYTPENTERPARRSRVSHVSAGEEPSSPPPLEVGPRSGGGIPESKEAERGQRQAAGGGVGRDGDVLRGGRVDPDPQGRDAGP